MNYSKQHKQMDLIYDLSLLIGTLLLAAAWPLSFALPVSISFENGPLENLQVVVLVLGGIYNLTLIRQSSDKQLADFHLWCAVFMIFMAFRELSWGRVFYPIKFEKTGPVFVDMANFVWQTEAYAIIGIFIIFLAAFMLRNLPLKRMLHSRFPILIIFAMLMSVIFSYIGDHGMIVGKLQGQIVEEFGELAFYVLIPALCIHYHRELSKA